MKMRNILSSLLFAYALTGVGLLLLAFFLYVFKLGETAVDVGIILICIFVCFMGGLMTGRFLRENRAFWGMLTGLAYFLLLLIVSFAVKRRLDMRVVHACDHFLYVYWGWNFGRNAVVKKSFHNL